MPLFRAFLEHLHIGAVPPEDILHSFFVSDYVHAILRTLMAVASVSLAIFEVSNEGVHFFRAFTNLSFTLLAVYYTLTAGLTLHVWKIDKHNGIGDDTPEERRVHHSRVLGVSLKRADSNSAFAAPRNLNRTTCERLSTLTWIIFEIVSTNAVFLTIVYWALLFNPKKGPSAWDLIAHCANAVLILVELVLNVFPFVWAHATFIIVVDIAYLIFAWSYFASTGKWVYWFLDWSKPSLAAIVYPSLIVFALLIFTLLLLFTRLRHWVAHKLQVHVRGSSRGSFQVLDDDPELEALEVIAAEMREKTRVMD